MGRQKKLYHVHEDLLCHHSAYFRGVFQGRFEEGRTKTLELEDEKSAIVELLIEWLYYSRIDFEPGKTTTINFVKLWIFADKCLMPDLKNYAIDLLHTHSFREDVIVLRPSFPWIWEHTGDDSKLRDFLVDRIIYRNRSFKQYFANIHDDTFPHSMLMQILLRIGQMNAIPDNVGLWKDLDLCAYHEHPTGKRCQSK